MHYIALTSKCMSRGRLRRLFWRNTLVESGESNSTAHRVWDPAQERYLVLKTFPCNGGERRTDAVLEVAYRLQDVRSRHLARVDDAFHHCVDTWHQVFVLSEYAPRGELHLQIGAGRRPVRETDLLRWAEQIALGLRALHRAGMLHRNLTTRNVFLSKTNDAKLGVLKFFRPVGFTRDGKGVVTPMQSAAASFPQFVAPEVRRGGVFTAKADVFALGAVVFSLAMRRVDSRLHEASLSEILAERPLMRYRRWLREFLQMTLQPNPANRASIDEVVELLWENADDIILLAADPRPVGWIN
jgi:serine/threonine protein kinase